MELNMDSAEELQSYIHKLSLSIEQTKQKILQAEVSVEVDVVDSKPEVPHTGIDMENSFKTLFSWLYCNFTQVYTFLFPTALCFVIFNSVLNSFAAWQDDGTQ